MEGGIKMELSKITEETKKELSKLTGLKASAVTSVSKEGNDWIVQVELVEKESIPDGMDILGTYEVRLNGSGEIVNFNRIKLRKRMDTVEG